MSSKETTPGRECDEIVDPAVAATNRLLDAMDRTRQEIRDKEQRRFPTTFEEPTGVQGRLIEAPTAEQVEQKEQQRLAKIREEAKKPEEDEQDPTHPQLF